MYRTAARRFLLARPQISLIRSLTQKPPRFSSSATSETVVDQSPNLHQEPPHAHPQTPIHSESAASSSSSSRSNSTADDSRLRYESHASRESRHRAEYQEEQARVLSVSLRHVHRFGWTEAAMIAGAREAGLSPSIIGSFPRKEAALVEFFMDECLQRLIDRIDLEEDLKNLIPSELVSKLIRIRLEMQAPYISKWPQALSIQAQPQNLPTSFKQRAMLADEIWHAAGDDSNDIDWYAKRTVLGAIYSTTEVYMLTDSSPDFRDTWAFLDGRVKDAFELRKSFQEAKHLAEAVNAGMGGSLQGFMKKVFQG